MGSTTFGMGAPELRRKIQENAHSQGILVTLQFLRQFTDTNLLYGAMRASQSGRTNHPILRKWLKEHPSEEVEEPPWWLKY